MSRVNRIAAYGAAILKDHNFREVGGLRFRRRKTVVELGQTWFHGESIRKTPVPLGRPGLWKSVTNGETGQVQREIHVPAFVFSDEDLSVDAGDCAGNGRAAGPLRGLIDWTLSTGADESPDGWVAPRKADVDEWVEGEELTVQTGPFVLQAVIECEGRLAVRCPIVAHVPIEMSEIRRGLLERVVDEANNRWRMVRVGFDQIAGGEAILAEVDLTGAPEAILPRLLKAALDAVKCVTELIVWPAGFLVDAAVTCRAWEDRFVAGAAR